MSSWSRNSREPTQVTVVRRAKDSRSGRRGELLPPLKSSLVFRVPVESVFDELAQLALQS
jgi:hypothetical protein